VSDAAVLRGVPQRAALREDPNVQSFRLRALRPSRAAARWLSIFGGALTLFLIRLLVPVPIGQADNRDGPRLMCGRPLSMSPLFPHGDPRYFRYAYFPYASIGHCQGHLPYPSSEVAPLLVARALTPVLGLRGQLNLIALGVLICALAAVGIASLVTGLRIRLWAQLLIAAAIWLIMADAAFFDVFASPFEEPAVLVGLLLVAAGLVYLGRSARATAWGLILAGTGGILAILSKEQYLILAVPVCPALILVTARRPAATAAARRRWSWPRRLRTRQVATAAAVAGVLALGATSYAVWDATSSFGQRLHHIQATDTIFQNIVTGHDNVRADLRALGLPRSWARYAGRFYWSRVSPRKSPLYPRYEAQLTDTNVAHFLLTHPGRLVGVAQKSARQAQLFRITELGNYPPDAGYRKGAVESRVAVVTWLMRRLPRWLGLWWLLPLWAALAAAGIAAVVRRRRPWHRDGGAAVLCLVGCAIAAFVPPGFFEGISTTRHMVGMNLATMLAIPVAAALAASMFSPALRRPRPRAAPRPATAEVAAPAR
jgi:hypothetical protein